VLSRKPIHSERLWSFTDDGIEDAYQRGHSWVQRNYREWPYGHALMYQVRARAEEDWLDFFFVPSDDGQGGEVPIPILF
jgi:hypothetical protein